MERTRDDHETRRIAALRATELLDSAPEVEFDDLTTIASELCGTPIALVSLVDVDRQWFKSRVGLKVVETTRDVSFCAHAIHGTGIFEVHDALEDPRFASNPLVTGDPNVRFYAGVPLVTDQGALGTICVLDRVPRTLTAPQRAGLDALARQTMRLLQLRKSQLELRTAHARLETSVDALVQSEERFRRLFEAAPVPMTLIGMDARFREVNDAWCALLGFSRDELVGQSMALTTDAVSPDAFVAHVDQVAASGVTTVHLETSCVSKRGARVDVELDARILLAANGRPGQVFTVYQDITARRAAEAAQGRLVAILDETIDVVAIAAPDRRLAYVNAAGRSLMGIGAVGGLDGVSLDRLYGATAARVVADIALPAALRDGSWSGETELQRHDGVKLPVSQVVLAHRDAAGLPQFLSVVARDISAQKSVERLKSDLVATVSHELRTPLTAIRGAIGLLEGGLGGALDASGTSLAEIARSNCDRLIRLVNDLLDLEKMEAGRLELRRTATVARTLVEATLAALRITADAAGVTFVTRVEVDDEAPIDHDRLVQVLINLVANAVQFSPRGACVEVSVTRVDPERVRFAVVDHGPGIAPRDVELLFQPFQQLPTAAPEARRGSGLGLSISRGIVEQHRGRIGVESVVGRGSTFWFELPWRDGRAGGDRRSIMPPRVRADWSVLVIDDDPVRIAAVRARIGARCERFARAADGSDVERALSDESFDLVLLGPDLPERDAVEWARTARARGRRTRIARLADASTTSVLNPAFDASLALDTDAETFTALAAQLLARPIEPERADRRDRVRAALQELREAYARALPERVAQLATHVRDARADGDAAPSWNLARLDAHRLRGSAGSHGFPEVGEQAGAIEDAILRVLDGDSNATRDANASIESGVVLLGLLAQRAAPRPQLG